MENVLLSIYVATYNHEKYITKALDSILKQKTDYSYEVLVGEDYSTDRTREVLMKYEEEHPGRVNVFYRDHNMSHDNINNAGDLKRRCRGKYIIALEGDDYWIDSEKIDKQIRFLEEHPEYLAVAHRCIVVDKESNPKGNRYPECHDREYTFRHYVSEIMPGQLTTVMYRNIYHDKTYDTSVFKKQTRPGDRVLYFWLLANGKVFCMPEEMSAYRHITEQGSSWSANFKYRFIDWEKHYAALLEYSRSIKNREAEKYAEFLYLKNIFRGLKEKQCGINDGYIHMKNINHKIRSFLLYLMYRINKNILHKQFWI